MSNEMLNSQFRHLAGTNEENLPVFQGSEYLAPECDCCVTNRYGMVSYPRFGSNTLCNEKSAVSISSPASAVGGP